MSNHNYSQYSNNKKKKSNNRNIGTAMRDETIDQFAVVDEVANSIEPTAVKMAVETVETVSMPAVVTGIVANCSKLNVRVNPNTDAEVVTILNVGSEIKIDPARSTSDWLKITTAAGVEGYCMRKFVNAKM